MMVSKGLVIAFESPPGSGKTTLLGELQKDGHPVIWEYVYYANGHEHFPAFISHRKKELENRINYFVNLEKRRAYDIKNIIIKWGYCFVDRSPLTFLAIEHAMPICYGNKVYSNINLVASMFQKVAESGDIILPTQYILLETPVEMILRRLTLRGEMPYLFFHEPSIEDMYHTYKSFLKKCSNQDSSLVLQSGTSTETLLDIERLKESVLDFLKMQQRYGSNAAIHL